MYITYVMSMTKQSEKLYCSGQRI